MEQCIVNTCHKNCNLHGMAPKCQVVCRRSYALIQQELNIRPRSATAREPTNSWVPTCELLRRHSSTTNTRMLPSVPTTKTIHSTTTLMYVNQPTFDSVLEVDELAVVPSLVSSFANDTVFVEFILACNAHRVAYFVPATTERFILRRVWWICITFFYWSHRAFSALCGLSHTAPMVSCIMWNNKAVPSTLVTQIARAQKSTSFISEFEYLRHSPLCWLMSIFIFKSSSHR